MMDELDPFDFVLSESLSMTVEEMKDRMSNREYLMWRAFYVYRAAMKEFELKNIGRKQN
jgi:hypothetical protein